MQQHEKTKQTRSGVAGARDESGNVLPVKQADAAQASKLSDVVAPAEPEATEDVEQEKITAPAAVGGASAGSLAPVAQAS